MKRIMIFTTLLSAVVMCGIVFSGCYTYLAAGQGDDRDDPWVERWSGWYAQDLEQYPEPVYPNTVIVNRYWHSTDFHSFHRNVYDWYHGCWVLEPEFRISVGWTDGWFDWDFGWDWDWTWDHGYRPVFWHPPVWALRMWDPPMAYYGWWPHHGWTRPYWGGWRHEPAYAYDHGHRHSDWMNPPAYYPDQPRIQNRRAFEARRGADIRRNDRIETAAWNAPSRRDTGRRVSIERAGSNTGNRATAAEDRTIRNNRQTERQAVRREQRTIEPVSNAQARPSATPDARSSNRSERRIERTESRPSVTSESRFPSPEFQTPNSEFRSSNRSERRVERTESRPSVTSESRFPSPEFRTPNSDSRDARPSATPEARSSRREFRTPSFEPRSPNTESRVSNPESRTQNSDSRFQTPDSRSTNRSERRIERTESRPSATADSRFQTPDSRSSRRTR